MVKTAWLRRLALSAAGALLLTTTTAVNGSAAAAPWPSASTTVDAEVLEIISTETSMTAPSTASPGPTTFHSSTTHEESGWVGIARVHDDGSMTYLGGAVVHPGKSALFTQTLYPGEYHLFDYLHTQEGSEPREQRLTVEGPESGTTPEHTATITSRHVPGKGPRFVTTGTLYADQPIEFVNTLADQYNEAVLFPLGEDVTEEDLQAFFDALGEGESPDPPFDTSAGLGVLPLSPDQSAVLELDLEPGRHVVVTWVRDQNGEYLAEQGQFEVVDVL